MQPQHLPNWAECSQWLASVLDGALGPDSGAVGTKLATIWTTTSVKPDYYGSNCLTCSVAGVSTFSDNNIVGGYQELEQIIDLTYHPR